MKTEQWVLMMYVVDPSLSVKTRGQSSGREFYAWYLQNKEFQCFHGAEIGSSPGLPTPTLHLGTHVQCMQCMLWSSKGLV